MQKKSTHTNSDQSIKRQIRSFVRRDGRMTPAQQQALNALWPKYGLDKNDLSDLDHIFPRRAPRFLEIGCGIGDAIISLARQNPDNDYIGIEVYLSGLGMILQGIEKYSLKNIRLVQVDAIECLRETIADSSFNGVMVFFPDPWPKKRHNKRRLIQPAFMSLIANKLRRHGQLFVATDWQDYADHIIEISTHQEELINLAGNEIYAPRPAWRPLTRYEKRALRLQHTVRDFVFTLA